MWLAKTISVIIVEVHVPFVGPGAPANIGRRRLSLFWSFLRAAAVPIVLFLQLLRAYAYPALCLIRARGIDATEHIQCSMEL